MRYTRRSSLALLAGIAITPLAAFAQQDYPTRPITLVVPYGAGGTTDISARQMATMAEKILGQAIVVENQPGASGTVPGSSAANRQSRRCASERAS